jgi:hypothetical protein
VIVETVGAELAWREWRLRSRAVAAGVLCAVLLTAGLVMHRTRAAFTGSTDNPASSWASGTVILGDDDSGSALFSATGLYPGDSGQRCIRVTYTGTVTAPVRLYGSVATGALAPYVDLVVEEAVAGAGNTGSYAGGCSGFSGNALYSGTLSALNGAASDYATGLGTFTPSSSGEYRVYRVAYTVNASAPDAAQGQSAAVTFSWQANS